MSEIITIKCPFCKEGDIRVMHRDRQVSVKKSICRAGGRNLVISHSKDSVLGKCPKCGISEKELQKAIIVGKEVLAKDAAKRAEESGLPTKF
jgi:hypothetical protein